MKKIICACLLSALALTVCSCSSPPSETERIYNEERVEYDIEDSFRMNLYGGKVYAVSMSGYENAEDEQVEGETVYVFDENGKKFDKLTLKGAYVSHCWDIADGRIYSVGDMSYSSEENGGFVSRRILYSSDIETGDTVEVCDFEGIAHVYKIAAVGDRLYWLGQSEEFRPFSEMLYPNEGGYVNCSENGNVFGCIDISTGVCTEINISHPVAFSERNGRIVIYAYEEDKGYYFYDNEAEKVICYTNKLGQLSDFDIINDNNDFVFKDYDGSFGDSLAFSGMDGESGVIQLDDGLWPSQFSSEGDYLCVQAAPTMTAMGSNEKIYKYMINISTADPPLRVITASDIIKQDPLFSCGFQIKTDSLTQESFSLTVLSLDKDYDMAMMSSSESYSAEIKDKGSFYPLNDIPGVEEYINRCFPSIKEAAADKNGDIWMLPISVDIPVLIYNEENCADKGIFFSSELDGFFEETEKGADYPKYTGGGNRGSYYIIQSLLNSYLSENDSFDTEVFRELAPKLKENYKNEIFNNNSADIIGSFYNNKLLTEMGRGLPDSFLYEEIYEKALFTFTGYLSEQQNALGDENLRAVPLPTTNEKNSAFCTFVCVNPNSEHLAEVLLFIERSVSRFANKKNGFTLTDQSLYYDDPYTQSLYSVYENSEIAFSVPLEIYRNTFDKYLNGSISLDEFIAEADRKLAAYLNE